MSVCVFSTVTPPDSITSQLMPPVSSVLLHDGNLSSMWQSTFRMRHELLLRHVRGNIGCKQASLPFRNNISRYNAHEREKKAKKAHRPSVRGFFGWRYKHTHTEWRKKAERGANRNIDRACKHPFGKNMPSNEVQQAATDPGTSRRYRLYSVKGAGLIERCCFCVFRVLPFWMTSDCTKVAVLNQALNWARVTLRRWRDKLGPGPGLPDNNKSVFKVHLTSPTARVTYFMVQSIWSHVHYPPNVPGYWLRFICSLKSADPVGVHLARTCS